MVSVVSLFAGIGGLDLGFIREGFEVVYANDFDEDAVATYRAAIGPLIECADIWATLDALPRADVLIGGPPCQSFSLVGQRLDSDPRTALVSAFLAAISRVRPAVFVMENVVGLASASTSGTRVLDVFARAAEREGYSVSATRINAADHGVPQRRVRLFVIGTLKAPRSFDPTLATEIANRVTVEEAMGDLPSPSQDRRKLLEYPSRILSAYAAKMRGSSASVSLHFVPTMSDRDKAFAVHVPPGGNYRDIPDNIATPRILRFKMTGGRTTTYGKLRPDREAYTLNTYFNRPNVGVNFHYAEPRLITPREGLRLQSFGDDVVPVFSSQRSLFRQIGNAVPPLLASEVARRVKRALRVSGNGV